MVLQVYKHGTAIYDYIFLYRRTKLHITFRRFNSSYLFNIFWTIASLGPHSLEYDSILGTTYFEDYYMFGQHNLRTTVSWRQQYLRDQTSLGTTVSWVLQYLLDHSILSTIINILGTTVSLGPLCLEYHSIIGTTVF